MPRYRDNPKPPAFQAVSAAASSMLATMVVVLPAFWTIGQLGRWWSPPLASVVVAVMLGVALPSALRSIRRPDWAITGLAVLVATGLTSIAVVWLGAGGVWRILGAAAFAGLAGLATWLRRFGVTAKAIGLAVGLPLIADLVAPMPNSLTWRLVLWVAVGAAAACVWAYSVAWLSAPIQVVGATTSSAPHRLFSSTRLAIQTMVALGLAAGAGQLTDQAHLVWPVLTALIVLSNNRGRGDVLWKGAQRLVGALIGTAVATLVTGWWPAGDSRAVVAIFVLIAVGSAARVFGYVYWAACITAGLAFLYGYLGQGGVDTLGHRLIGIAIGGLIAVAVAWFLLPVRTVDVVRLRDGEVRRAIAAIKRGVADGSATADQWDELRRARAALAQMAPTAKAASFFGIGAPARGLADSIRLTIGLADAIAPDENPELPAG